MDLYKIVYMFSWVCIEYIFTSDIFKKMCDVWRFLTKFENCEVVVIYIKSMCL